MTTEQIRIAVAEEMGYEHMPNAVGLMWNHKANRAVITPGSEVEKARIRMKMPYIAGEHTLPNYHASLDACAEFEKTVKDWPKYLGNLARAIAGCDSKTKAYVASSVLVCATASQRCEAFLRLRNRWKD